MSVEINRDLIRKKIEELGIAVASINGDVGISTLEKLRSGVYPSKLSRRTIKKICRGLNIKEEDLFIAAG